MNSIELKPCEEQDHYELFVNGVNVFGKQEKSVYRHLIEVIDNGVAE